MSTSLVKIHYTERYLHVCIVYSYGGGTHPWNKSGGAFEPSTEDGLIEVVGLTTYQLVSRWKIDH